MEQKTKIEELKESIGDIIIAMLLSNRSSYQFKKIIEKRELARYKKESIQIALSRLRKTGYIIKSVDGWSAAEKSKLYSLKNKLFSYFISPFNKDSQINNIVSFDIPEINRIKRNWLRNQLKIFGYKMLQQSLWLGPGPLPAFFIKRLSELEIKNSVKIFKINK
jgi:DNA-binding transcriptional regulator PaaX